ncbi:hypothetical protein AYO44_10630 [Planctomycetaceae bacterium SCGC AG-212-F19]|nr:hypothetical protein AYO44_10630 [Planctomycetaceae bacterium SCGC AG-212-F19]
MELTEHLNDCGSCADRLEKLAADFSLVDSVKLASQELAPAHSAYWPAVQALERAAGQTSDGGATTPDSAEPSLEFLAPSDQPGHIGRLGNYEVVREIGRGAMGIVLQGFDTHLQRNVALKVIAPQLATDEMARKRFCREARAAAAITHEHVVTVHHVEREDSTNLPFLVMQFVKGESLELRLERAGPLPLKDILRIGMQIATGLAAAHTQGLIHRDIKPDNILLETPGDRVKLTDFGLARAAEDVKLTASGLIAGTPAYMSPEQARGEPLDARSDLFSLGSVLYAMSTGRAPFDGASAFVVLRKITDEPPPPIAEINPDVPSWLVDIIDKLLAKKPADRFQSAQEVADLFGQLLTRLEAVGAPPLPNCPVYRHKVLVRRAWMAAAAFLVGGMVVAELTGVAHFFALGPRRGTPAASAPADDAPSPALRATLNGNAGPVWSTAYAPDGGTLAMAIDDGTVRLWEPSAVRVRGTINAHKGPIWSLAYAPDGRLLATASDDGLVKLWEMPGGKERQGLPHPTSVRALAFAPDGKRVVTGSRNGVVRVWDVASGSEAFATTGQHAGTIVAVAFARDGKTIASAGGDKVVKLWDAHSGQELLTLQGHTGGVYTVAFSPDSKTVASGSWDKTIKLWDAASGSCLRTLQGHTQDVWAVAFSPDGKTLASASEDRTVKLWDTATGNDRATFKGHTGTLYAVTFAPTGDVIASGGRDGTVRLWDAGSPGGNGR